MRSAPSEVLESHMTLTGFHQPFGFDLTQSYAHPQLSGDANAETVVVGGGITGLTSAARLTEAGHKVTLIEMNQIGGGTTGHSTGHLDSSCDERWHVIIKMFGRDSSGAVAGAKKKAIDFVEDTCRRYGIDCGFTRVAGFLYTENPEGVDDIEREYEAAHSLGLPVALEFSAPLPFNIERAIRFEQQARFNPLQYVQALAKALADYGCLIYEQTQFTHFEEHDDRIEIDTNRGKISCETLVLAGHVPLAGKHTLQPLIQPFQSYVIAAQVPNQIFDGLYWDNADPYHYTRMASDDRPDLLIIGNADHATGDTQRSKKSLAEIELFARERFNSVTVENYWSSTYFNSVDHLPFAGRVPGTKSVYVAGAYAGDGLSFGTASGMIVADLILGNKNLAAEALSPSRIKPLTYAKRMGAATVTVAKHFFAGRITEGQVDSLDEVPRGEGQLVKISGSLAAVYRDEDDSLSACSAKCTHMGCIVQWNPVEKSWDCPCHGSRYDTSGRPFFGPTNKNLAPIELEIKAAK